VIFPRSIRATAHAKLGQAVIPKLGRGIRGTPLALLTTFPLGPDAVRTLPLWKVRRSEYRPVYRRIRLNPLRTFEKRSPKAGKVSLQNVEGGLW
jgi:hypothetical protein